MTFLHALTFAAAQAYPLRRLPVRMAEIAAGIDHVADQLLELRRIGKAAVAFAVPDDRFVAGDGEDSAGAGNQGHLAKLVPKVESNSCAIHAALSSQWHWVQ